MHRFSSVKRLPIGLVLIVGLTAGACGGPGTATPTGVAASSQPVSAGPTANGSAAAPSAAPLASGSAGSSAGPSLAAFQACDLLSADQVKALLGAAGTASETDYAPNYEVCGWLTSGSGNVNALRLGVTIKVSPADKGFAPVPAADSPQPVTGLGDDATYGAKGDDTGFGSKLLVVNKGPASVSLEVQYGGSLRAPDSTQANMIAAIKPVLSTLGQNG